MQQSRQVGKEEPEAITKLASLLGSLLGGEG